MDRQAKLQKITAISNEVAELHPLINDILNGIPQKVLVEYTHGTQEMGADFIFIRNDDILLNETFIGILIKCGDIKQNLADVERQISECIEIPRKVISGRSDVYLNEIWIVSNGSISNNAKEKIHAKYRNTNIRFIMAEKLIDLIDRHYPQYWVNIDGATVGYLSTVAENAQNRIIRQSVLANENGIFYIPQEVSESEKTADYVHSKSRAKQRKQPETSSLLLALEKHDAIFLEGAMGQGKSRLLNQLVTDVADNDFYAENRIIPIYISFSDLIEKYNNIYNNILTDITEKRGLLKDIITKVLVIVDGVDEYKCDESEKISYIALLTHDVLARKHKIVLASRYLENPENVQRTEKIMNRYQLRPLNIQKMFKFVEAVCGNIANNKRLKSDAASSNLFRQLPRTPMSAILMGRVLQSNINELPSTMPELYNKYVDLALGRWDILKGLMSEKDYETAVIIIRKLAAFMFDSKNNQVGVGDLRGIISDYLKDRETGQTNKEVFDYIVSRNEILYVDLDGNRISFKHTSLLEYVYADALYHSHKDNVRLTWKDGLYMSNVNYFYIGKIKDCPDLLDSMFAGSATSDNEVFSKVHQIGQCLMAAYQTPYSSIEKWLRVAIIEISCWYSDIKKNPEKTQLSMLPEIQLVLAMAGVVSFIFGYEFFNKALRSIEAEFYCEQGDEYSNRFNVFLVEAVRAYIGNADAFDNFLSYKKSPNPELDLAISVIADHQSIKNRTITEIDKRIRKFSSSHNNYVKELIEKPINARKNLPF
jgi:hypothetical protein